MADLIQIRINTAQFDGVLRAIEAAGHNMAPAFRAIAMELVDLTEERLDAEGPGWPELAASTIAQREQDGHWPGKMLQVSGGLAASVGSEYGPAYALVGASKIYAAIQQLGGTVHHAERQGQVHFKQHKNGEVGTRFVKKGKANFVQDVTIGAHDTEIPARPYLPIDEAGNLLPEAEQAALEAVLDYLARSARP